MTRYSTAPEVKGTVNSAISDARPTAFQAVNAALLDHAQVLGIVAEHASFERARTIVQPNLVTRLKGAGSQQTISIRLDHIDSTVGEVEITRATLFSSFLIEEKTANIMVVETDETIAAPLTLVQAPAFSMAQPLFRPFAAS